MNLRKRGLLSVLALLVAALALLASGCGGDDDDSAGGGDTTEASGGGGSIEALPSSSCTALEYEGEGEPDVLIASDFPLQGSSRTQTIQIVEAIRYLLEQADWKAGDHNVAFQSCDDATAQAAQWDSGKCSTNAQAYAANESVIGVIGTFNSGCAAIEIPVLNQAPGGGVAMISPANTYVCLTEGGPGCDDTEPDKYYPTGSRNYARVVAHDAYQGAAVAEFMQSQGVTSVYILNDKEAYGLGVATNLRNAAEHLGIEIAGFEAWDPKASSYEALFRKIGGTNADAVFLGGLIDENGAQVIKDKVAVLGPNDGDVKLIAPDGFTTQQTIDESGEAAAGMFLSVAGVPIDQFEGEGAEFAEAFAPRIGGDAIDPYAIYGAQAAAIMLEAIGNSDGSRASVIEEMFKVEVEDGYLGSFSINEAGDPQGAEGAVVGFTIYRATDKLETETTISPQPENVDAARG
ncbi:MAG TPA: branched-chain amino acid ABC transporter substrate-binding protein [Candidatus Limnocylindrales bacterium]|nr:branched-chain amino acid ABC transporter substrate-binding protein [Candidatus Limnocylindrales bacterium]